MNRQGSRAGRTGGSWYGSYKVAYWDTIKGAVVRYDVTNKRHALRSARRLVEEETALWAEVWAEVYRDGKLKNELVRRYEVT